ncbi:hypothetical protein COLU111180_09635 [Cohnella lubricantis]|uniref:hypothetical protein n=1 Tax=Cohnella lubricantis TaxID=2163172 RepID=UPI001FD89A39|nr:hypothetical protein [Cohnella lubricantis]MBP2116809.1 hypothetical protein [Cohnella lubricantis]
MFVPASIQIGSIELNNCDHAGAVSFGVNHKLNRNVRAKKNQGFGQQFADQTLRFAAIQLLLDEESSDSIRSKADRR